MRTTIHTVVVCTIACLTIVNRAVAQEFDAADVHAGAGVPSIHLPGLNSAMRGGSLRAGRYELRSATMVDLIGTAYHVEPGKIIGGPAWMEADLFDLAAKAPAGTTPDSLRLMLQALLADRFGLSVHKDMRPLPGFALISGSRPQLKSSTEGAGGCQSTTQAGPIQTITITCRSVTMAEFANRLPQITGSYMPGNPVADLTGLDGAWSFTFKITSRNTLLAAGSDGISLSEALEKQLGLKLETRDLPTPVLVVDKVNRKPTANAAGVERMLPALPAKFDVADIRPTGPELTQKAFRSQPGGLVEVRGFTVADLIRMAWEIADLDAIDHEDLLMGAPKWTERFDILARAEGSDRLDPDSVRFLLRELLADRFKLQSHLEQRMIDVDA